jgi:PPIC-type PPIASE domain
MAAVFALVSCGATAPSDVVAIVEGTPISRAAFDQEMSIASAAHASLATRPPVPPRFTACAASGRAKEAAVGRGPSKSALRSACQATYSQLRATAMNFLVRGAWIVEEARALGIHLDAVQINAEYAHLKARQFPQADAFAAFLKTSGETVADLRYRVVLDLLREKLEAKVESAAPRPTMTAIADYFAANGHRFDTPAQRDVRIIRVARRSTAAKIKALIRDGLSFAAAAKRYSLDLLTRDRGGLALGVSEGTEPLPLNDALFSAPTAAVTGPIAVPSGYVVFKVQRIIPPRRRSLAEATPAIREVLIGASRQHQLASFDATFAAKWRTRTRCMPAFADPQVCP